MTPILRFLYACYRFSTGTAYWGRRRLGPVGFAVLGTLLFTALLGPDTENNVAYQAFAIALALMLVSGILSLYFRMRFEAIRVLPRFGTVGSVLEYQVRIRNLTRRVQKGLIFIEDLADQRPDFKEWREARLADEKMLRSFRVSQGRPLDPFKHVEISEAPVPPMLPKQEVTVPARLTPMRRGLLSLRGVTLARPDPLGIFRALARAKLWQNVLILPRRYPLPPVALPGTLKYQHGGVVMASNVGQSEEFVALRDYRHGDPLRHIHWRTWAKAGKPVVKEFEDEFFVRHALVLDTFTEHPRSELFEEAVSVAASFACSIQTQESLLDLLFVGPQSYCFTAGRGLAHTEQMLEVLASVQTCSNQPFETIEPLVFSHIESVSGCICVLVAWDELRRKFVEKLKALGVPTLVLVVSAAGKSGGLDAGPMSDDPENLHFLEAGRVEECLARL